MRDRPNISVIGMTDLQDQPKGHYVFITEGLLGLRQAFYVDKVSVQNGVVTAEKHVSVENEAGRLVSSFYRIVIQVPATSVWGVIDTDYTYTQTYREALEKRKKAVDDEAEMAKSILGIVEGAPTPDNQIPVTLGHYL